MPPRARPPPASRCRRSSGRRRWRPRAPPALVDRGGLAAIALRDPGDPVAIRSENVDGLVRGAAVHHEVLDLRIALREHTLDGLADEPPLVEGRGDDRDERTGAGQEALSSPGGAPRIFVMCRPSRVLTRTDRICTPRSRTSAESPWSRGQKVRSARRTTSQRPVRAGPLSASGKASENGPGAVSDTSSASRPFVSMRRRWGTMGARSASAPAISSDTSAWPRRENTASRPIH